ncbi:hypothetical protein GGS20DRAFT_560997 [Poronia punctata]|nr:hypothetical protein GGS20DRAFT_560997 [Poronia punctata]
MRNVYFALLPSKALALLLLIACRSCSGKQWNEKQQVFYAGVSNLTVAIPFQGYDTSCPSSLLSFPALRPHSITYTNRRVFFASVHLPLYE